MCCCPPSRGSRIYRGCPWSAGRGGCACLRAAAAILLQFPFQVSTVRMQGVILLVFAKYYHLPFLQDIQTDCTRTGLGGYWVSSGEAGGGGASLRAHGSFLVQGNKGGVSVRLSIFGHMVCFLNCHLPAHLEKAEQRKEDFATILHMQQFEGRAASGILDHECVPRCFSWSLSQGNCMLARRGDWVLHAESWKIVPWRSGFAVCFWWPWPW